MKPLGCHVEQSPDDLAAHRQLVAALVLGQPKSVTQISPGVQQKVGRLDVTMEDALLVGVFKGLGDLDADSRDATEVLRLGLGRELGSVVCSIAL